MRAQMYARWSSLTPKKNVICCNHRWLNHTCSTTNAWPCVILYQCSCSGIALEHRARCLTHAHKGKVISKLQGVCRRLPKRNQSTQPFPNVCIAFVYSPPSSCLSFLRLWSNLAKMVIYDTEAISQQAAAHPTKNTSNHNSKTRIRASFKLVRAKRFHM